MVAYPHINLSMASIIVDFFTHKETEAWAEDASGKSGDEGLEPGLCGPLTSLH